MKRRSFIKLSIISAVFLLTPIDTIAKKNRKKTLVLIELDGGNDGLNTFVPYSSKKYYSLRPTIAIKKNDLNIVNKDYGLNKNLKNIYSLYKQNNVAIINGLGYKKPNLSHFKSIEIVETASTGHKLSNEGWISAHLRKYDLNELRPANALLIGKRKKGHLFSKDLVVLQVKNIKDFVKKSQKLNLSNTSSSNNNLDFLFNQEKNISNASRSFQKYLKDINISSDFEESTIATDFQEALKVIKSNLDIPAIKVSQKGYDTHSNQVQRQSELLKQLDDAIGSFVKELKTNNLFDNVLIMTYSEFGRRVKENGSLGTDHGTASVQFILGGSVKGGIYGETPSLDKLKKNNLIYTTEYASLYNTILSKWFRDTNNKFKSYNLINFI